MLSIRSYDLRIGWKLFYEFAHGIALKLIEVIR